MVLVICVKKNTSIHSNEKLIGKRYQTTKRYEKPKKAKQKEEKIEDNYFFHSTTFSCGRQWRLDEIMR